MLRPGMSHRGTTRTSPSASIARSGYWHTRAAWATMPGWLVMTAGPRCCGWPCPFWMGPGPRGCSDGWARSSRLLPGLLSGPGTGPPGGGGGPWPRGRALLGSGWWCGAWARKRRPRPRCDRTWNRTCSGCKGRGCCASLVLRPRLPPGRRHPRPAAYRGMTPCLNLLPLSWATPCSNLLSLSWDGPRRVVGLALAAAADGARDRPRSPGRRDHCPLGGPGRAAAQAEDGHRVRPGRGRIDSPAAGSIG